MVKFKKKEIVFCIVLILMINVFCGRVIAPGSSGANSGTGFGSGLGSGFGSLNGDIQGALQAAQMVMQLISQIFGNLKTNLESNAQAEHTRLSKINAPRLPDDPTDSQNPDLNADTSGNRVNMNFTGMEITLSDRNTGNKLIVWNRANVVGMSNTNSSLENTITANTTTIVTKNNQDLGVVKVGDKTTLIDSGGAKTDSVSTNNIPAGFLPLVSAEETNVFSKEFSSQYVLFSKEDIFINGESILFFPLKSFDKIIANGSKLIIMEKDSDVIVNNDKILYSRKIGWNNFVIKSIINENNRDSTFSLLEGGTKGVYFIDNKRILSVGDSLVKNPLSGYENISIPRARFEMWKKAEEGV